MIEDTIVDEVRSARDKIAKDANYDLSTLFDRWRKIDEESKVKKSEEPLLKAK